MFPFAENLIEEMFEVGQIAKIPTLQTVNDFLQPI
jgi:hypothetical protein